MFVLKSLVAIFVLSLAAIASAAPVRPRACKPDRQPDRRPSAPVAVSSTSIAYDYPGASSTDVPVLPPPTPIPSPNEPAPTKVTSSSSPAAPSPTTPVHDGGSGLSRLLFPVPYQTAWSTADGVDNHVPLSDATFRQVKEIKDLAHPYLDVYGKKAMKAHYPAGSYNFKNQPRGGISFYAPGPARVDLTTAKEATFGYSVFFPDGFDFNMGGKLPGLYGGNSADEAVSCSGGSRSNACQSVRLMWRTDGQGEFYTYLPPAFDANRRVCNVKPHSDCNNVYGASIGRGSFNFKTGDWTTVSQRVRLNDAGKENGEIELFVEGRSLIKVGGLVLRDSDAGRLRGIMMQTFFGGSSPDWATPRDQDVFFADFSVAITETL